MNGADEEPSAGDRGAARDRRRDALVEPLFAALEDDPTAPQSGRGCGQGRRRARTAILVALGALALAALAWVLLDARD